MPWTGARPWTRKDIERWIVIAYCADPRQRSPGVAAAVAWIPLYVFESDDRVALHIWACAKAGKLDLRLSEWCAEHGLSRSTFEKRRSRGLAQIEESLNRQAMRKCA